MQTSAIHQRVVDFLKEFPPFGYLEEEALERLAADGRVLFREVEDVIFEEGKTRGTRIYVIQQGGVRISCRDVSGETLVDLRGVGEIVGLGEASGSPVYKRSAHAREDTILYALDAAGFHRECQASSRALRFLSLLSTADPLEPEATLDGRPVDWFREPVPAVDPAGGSLLSCPPETPVREAARRMAGVEDAALIVTDAVGCPLGICTSFDLRCHVATGEVSVVAPVGELMVSPVLTIPPGLSVGGCLLEMMRGGVRHLCVTEDGTTKTRALGTLSEHTLMALYGNNPLTVLRAIQTAGAVETLAALRDRVEGLLQRGLRTWADVDWYCEVVAEIDRALIRRVAALVRQKHDRDFTVSLILLGTAGRREKLARTEIGLAAIVPEESASTLVKCREYLKEVTAALERCGYVRRTMPGSTRLEVACRTVTQWETLFRSLVSEPAEGDIHKQLALFDFDPLIPGCTHARRLRDGLSEAVRSFPEFLRILARDAAAHSPPLTFFEGQAVDEEGKSLGVLDINDQAFWAVSDVARGLAFEFGEGEAEPALKRLERAAEALPEAAGVMAAAGRAVRIILFLRARNAFLTGGEGNVFLPDAISLSDQALLKFSFRAITKLLEFVRSHYRLE